MICLFSEIFEKLSELLLEHINLFHSIVVFNLEPVDLLGVLLRVLILRLGLRIGWRRHDFRIELSGMGTASSMRYGRGFRRRWPTSVVNLPG